MEKRITCKTHDSEEVITHVGVEGVKTPILTVWDEINDEINSFYTFEDNKKTNVYARTNSNNTKYLTTHPDGVTPNNLDELSEC